MQKLNKFFAVLLSVLMIFGTLATTALTASAKDFDDVAPEDRYSEQIDILSDMGIIIGTSDGTFSPNEPVTREQMALLLYRLMMGNDNAGRVNTSPFKDLADPTYHGAISWAYACRYILGTGATTFDPKGGITLQDAIAMISRALGQTNYATNAGYPWSYIDIGKRLGLTEDLQGIAYTKTLTRAETAALLYNALTADYVIVRNAGASVSTVTTTILAEVYGYEAASAILVATNQMAMPATSTVVKNGYVKLLITDKAGNVSSVLVKATDLGLGTDLDTRLGEGVSIFYKVNTATGIADILGAAASGRTKDVVAFRYDAGQTYVMIDGVKYNVVERYSDAASVNENELLVYAYGNDAHLTQIQNNAALIAKDGFFRLKLIYEGDTDVASRAVLMPLSLDTLTLSGTGNINIAGNLTSSALTGGLINDAKATDGDIVLYYYNSTLKRLVIAEKLAVISGSVNRFTMTTATIGDTVYELGLAGTPYTAQSVMKDLSLGKVQNFIVYRGAILAVTEESQTPERVASQYLIASGTTTPVVLGDRVCYFMKANLNGKDVSVYVTNRDVVPGALYRYTEQDGVLTLIPVDDKNFAQEGEIKTVISGVWPSYRVTIEKNGNVYYTLSNGVTGVRFVTDENTVILVKTASGFVYRKGAYASTITVHDRANVVAVMQDETGVVETLKFLYISDGALASSVSTMSSVQVLRPEATELVNGNVMTSYQVFNIRTGKLEVLFSASHELKEGRIYRLDEDGYITTTETSLSSGRVNGYAAGIVTIGETTYQVNADTQIVSIRAEGNAFTLETHSLAELYHTNVQFVAEGNTLRLILVNDRVD